MKSCEEMRVGGGGKAQMRAIYAQVDIIQRSDPTNWPWSALRNSLAIKLRFLTLDAQVIGPWIRD